MTAGILATALYRQLSFRMNLSRSFIVGSAANALCGLGRLLVVYSWGGEEVGPGRYCSPRHIMQFNVRMRVQNALSDVAGNEPGRYCYCPPRHRMPAKPSNEGSNCEPMTWRAIFARPYQEEKVGAPVAALVVSNLLGSFGLMAGFMPILALAAQVAPAGLEAFGYSLLLFTTDLGTSSGSLLSAQLTKVGPGRCRPPRHRMPINSRDEGTNACR